MLGSIRGPVSSRPASPLPALHFNMQMIYLLPGDFWLQPGQFAAPSEAAHNPIRASCEAISIKYITLFSESIPFFRLFLKFSQSGFDPLYT